MGEYGMGPTFFAFSAGHFGPIRAHIRIASRTFALKIAGLFTVTFGQWIAIIQGIILTWIGA
jgi:hypothetical protein